MFNLRKMSLTAAISLLSLPALAFDDTDKAAIATAADAVNASVQSGDFNATIDTIPPAVIAKFAEKAGASVDETKQAMVDALTQAMQVVTVEESTYDLDAAETGTSSEGRDYALIPTTATIKTAEGRIQSAGSMLAVKEEGEWYLMQLESPESVMTIFEVYPDLSELSPPEPTMTKLD